MRRRRRFSSAEIEFLSHIIVTREMLAKNVGQETQRATPLDNVMMSILPSSVKKSTSRLPKSSSIPSAAPFKLTVYHFRGHDSLSLAVFNGIVLWGATDQIGTGYRVPLAFESDIRSANMRLAI